MFNHRAVENTRPDGLATLEILGDGPDRKSSEARLFVPLRHTRIGGQIIGPLAALQITHTYGYTRDQRDQVLEAVYRFPLPGDAAVMSNNQ